MNPLAIRGLRTPFNEGPTEVFTTNQIDQFWRFTGELDTLERQRVTWLTSPDGVTYTNRMSFEGLAGFQHSRVILGGKGGAQASTIAFDSVGSPAP